MKTTIFVGACVAVISGCSFAARSPEMYRDDTQKVLAAKNDAIHACYDDVLKTSPGASGRVTVKFDVETEQGKIVNVAVDKSGTTAPDPVAACVTQNISGLAISPPDARLGQGSFVYEFTVPPAPSVPKG